MARIPNANGKMNAIRPVAALLACAVLLSACVAATPYQPAADRNGYSETKIESNRYLVSFRGNSFTPKDQVQTYLLFRAAELTLQSGFDWFRIVDETPAKRTAQSTPAPTASKATEASRDALPGAVPPVSASAEGLELFSKKYRHKRKYRHHRRYRRGSFVSFRFFHSPFYFPYHPFRYSYRGRNRDAFEASANVVFYRGTKPGDDPSAYDAREVVSNLAPEVIRPEE